MHDKFYVYTHHRATDGSVFYVGKGHGIRAYTKSSRNPHWHNVVKKNGYTINIVKEFDDENCCLTFEKILIAFYGIGNLTNQSTGGMPNSGTKWSEERRLKTLGKYAGVNNPNYGKSPSQETRDKLSKHFKGRPAKTKGMKYNISDALREEQAKRMKKITLGWIKKNPDHYFIKNNGAIREAKFKPVRTKCGMEFDAIIYAAEWLKSNGYPKATGSKIGMCCKGKRATAYGYKWEYKNDRTTLT